MRRSGQFGLDWVSRCDLATLRHDRHNTGFERRIGPVAHEAAFKPDRKRSMRTQGVLRPAS